MCLIACLESKHNLLLGLLRLVQKLKESINLKLPSGYCVFTLPMPFFKSILHRVNQVNFSNLNRTIALSKAFFIVSRIKCTFLKKGAKTLHKAFYIPFRNFFPPLNSAWMGRCCFLTLLDTSYTRAKSNCSLEFPKRALLPNVIFPLELA